MSKQTQPRIATAKAENEGVFSLLDWALFVGISVIWGASFLLIAEALDDGTGLTPGTVTLGRVGLGAVTLWLIRWRRPTGQTVEPTDRLRFIVLSLVWVGIPFTLFPLAQEHINSAVTGLLNGATPVFVGVISALFAKIVPKGVQLTGIALGFVGILLISLGSSSGGSSETGGVLMVLAATVCYGFAINLASPLQAKYGAIATMSNVLALATISVLPFGLWSLADNEWSIGPVVAVVALGSIGTGAAYWIMSTLVGRIGPIRASFITYLIPVVSLVLGVTIRGDAVAALAIIGAALTIGGALLASRRQTQVPSSPLRSAPAD